MDCRLVGYDFYAAALNGEIIGTNAIGSKNDMINGIRKSVIRSLPNGEKTLVARKN